VNVKEHGFFKPFSGYMAGEEYAFVKTFSYFPGNPKKYNRLTTSSQVILFDYDVGFPPCFMRADWAQG
jgi:ornithine cyclodeaminase/alanine dehydrogenase-like protein (mu-crystallin family)